MHTTGSWQAAGPGPGQDRAPGPGQYDPGMHTAGSWQAAGSGPGPDWPHQPGQQDPRNTGSRQAAGPGHGQDWAAGAGGYGHDPRTTGSWQAAGSGPSQAWTAGPYPEDPRATGGWQAAGTAGHGWTGPGQQQGQPRQYPGPGPYPGQYPTQRPGQPHPETGRLGEPHYADGGGVRNTGAFGRVGSPVIRQRDSALPDTPPGGGGPVARGRAPIAAIESDSVAGFARDLRVLRAKAGLDYPDMAEKSHYTMRTLASAAGGLRLPTLPVLIAYVNACGGDVAQWEERWGKLSGTARKGQVVALPAPEDRGRPGGGTIPPGARQTGEIYVITSAKMREERW
jgi:hypothetical protein